MLLRRKPFLPFLIIILASIWFVGCERSERSREQMLYATHCGSCHLPPDIHSLPKHIWGENILPDMAARMGIVENGYNPYQGLSFDEMEAVMKTGIYNVKPLIDKEDWVLLKDYILEIAPDSLNPIPEREYTDLSDFKEKPMALDSLPGSRNLTFLEYIPDSNELIYGDLWGEIHRYSWNEKAGQQIGRFKNPVISYKVTPEAHYVTTIGQLSPTQVPSGLVFTGPEGKFGPVPGFFHRPVHMLVEDLDGNGSEEIVVSEFGDLVGKLTLLYLDSQGKYEWKALHNLPGTIRVISEDMNNDQKPDLVVLTAQGEEGITIFYQQDDLKFRPDRVLRFSPVYGTSWFELLDYDGDGDQDIVTVHGDNADKSYVHKPYHGLRIHLNDGSNGFEEAYFYPLNGATRVLGRDFDQDGDQDFCVLATFPDYEKQPLLSFVYLKNEDSDQFKFRSEIIENRKLGRWLLAEAGDIDNDGDEDIMLSSFNYVFTPVPDSLNQAWKVDSSDMLILENQLNE